MTNLFPSDVVRISSEPYYRNTKFHYSDRSDVFDVGDVAEVIKGPDEDGDYKLRNTETDETGWVNGEHLERLPMTQPLSRYRHRAKENDNEFWALPCGDHKNLLDEAIERIEELERRVRALEARDE
jgi:hypothetical protein